MTPPASETNAIRQNAAVRISLAVAEILAPGEFIRETGRLVTLLARFPHGLGKEVLFAHFYPGFSRHSLRKQMSLRTRLEKVIQRSRGRFRPFGIDIGYCQKHRVWKLQSFPPRS